MVSIVLNLDWPNATAYCTLLTPCVEELRVGVTLSRAKILADKMRVCVCTEWIMLHTMHMTVRCLLCASNVSAIGLSRDSADSIG